MYCIRFPCGLESIVGNKNKMYSDLFRFCIQQCQTNLLMYQKTFKTHFLLPICGHVKEVKGPG